MVRDKANPLRRNRAVTLIEAVLYISIALALIVGGLVFFQQASTAAKTSATVRQLSATLAEARVLIKEMPSITAPSDVTTHLIAAGAVPPDMVASATSLSNPFGGTTSFHYDSWGPTYGRVVHIELTNVPQGVCARLLTSINGKSMVGTGFAGNSTLVSSGFVFGGAGPDIWVSTKGYGLNAIQAGWMCKYGYRNYQVTGDEPTSTPLSGNVNVSMAFKLDI